MKRLIALVFIILITVAACAYADTITGKPQPTVIIEKAEPVPAAPETEMTNEQPALEPEVETKKASTNYALMVGLFMPTDSVVRNTFGESWIRYGIRPLPKDLPEQWRLNFDISFYKMSNSTDRVYLVPVTVGALRGFNTDKNVQTYLAINAGPYYGDLYAPSVPVSQSQIGVNANITYGIIFDEKLSIEGRYEIMSDLGGYNFNAFTVSAAVKIFTAK